MPPESLACVLLRLKSVSSEMIVDLSGRIREAMEGSVLLAHRLHEADV